MYFFETMRTYEEVKVNSCKRTFIEKVAHPMQKQTPSFLVDVYRIFSQASTTL